MFSFFETVHRRLSAGTCKYKTQSNQIHTLNPSIQKKKAVRASVPGLKKQSQTLRDISKSACCYTQGSPSPSNTELPKVPWISEMLRRLFLFFFFFEAHYFIVKSFNIAHINISFHYIGLMNNAGRVEEGSQGQWLLLLLLFLFAVMALSLAPSYTLFSYCSPLLNWLVLFRENHCRPFCFLVMSLCSSCACVHVCL